MKAPGNIHPVVFTGIILAYPALSQAATDAEFNLLKNRLDQLAEAVEQAPTYHSSTRVGGYGELHYNNLDQPTGSRKKELDLHRFVLEISHQFNNDIRLFTELEVEHALVEDTADGSGPGEVEVEQAYVQIDLNDEMNLNAGVFLIPVGIINETHEPTAFYGVERNPVEKNIIPATWWEGGVMLSGRTASALSYDVALTSGLDGGTSIRGGRQKAAKASVDNLALTGRVRYTGIAGLELAATLQLQDDMTQDSTDSIDGGTLIETHAVWNTGPVTLKALYAQWDIDGVGASSTGMDSQNGGFLEAAYKLMPSTGVFIRHNIWDNGGTGDTEKTQSDFGINYWPHEDVVLKFDYQAQDKNAGDSDGFNLGVGYQF